MIEKNGREPDPPLSEEEWRRWWDSLAALDRSKAIGPASSRAFAWIWRCCRATVTSNHRLFLPDLAERFGVKIAAAKYLIEYLEKKELVWVRNRTLRRQVPEGWVVLAVYHPNPELRNSPSRANPQRLLGPMEDMYDTDADGDHPPPFAAGGPFSHLCRKGPTKVQERDFAKGPTKVQKRPCTDAILEGLVDSQLTMVEAFKLMTGEDSSGGFSRARAREASRKLETETETKARSLAHAKAPQKNLPTAEEFFALIHRGIGDPELQPQPVRKVADKLESGLLDWQTVQRVIDAARFKFRQGEVEAPWKYFVGAMRRIFEERGWQWRKRK